MPVPETHDRKRNKQNNPRGQTAGKQADGNEILVRKAARLSGCTFDRLLAWKVYPERVVVIDSNGSKHEVPITEIESTLLEEV